MKEDKEELHVNLTQSEESQNLYPENILDK
jgi:hypothetical protein